MNTIFLTFAFCAAYLCGSIPFGLIISKKYTGQDLRQHGSGNIGATNAWRIGGKRVGILTFLLDFLKGAVPVFFACTICLPKEIVIMIGGVTVLGHIFPVWLDFKGGKGIATMFGMSLVASPGITLLSALCWILIFKKKRVSSLASIISMIFLVLLSFATLNMQSAYVYLVLVTIIIMKHADNIKRLLDKKEH